MPISILPAKRLLPSLLLLLAACGGGAPARPGGGPATADTLPQATTAPPAAGSAAATTAPEATPPRGAPPHAAADTARPIVLFLGNSLTAGLGVAPAEAYPALVQQKIDSAGLDFRVVNAGVSGETTADGLRRVDWVLRGPVKVMVLELGANDMLRGQDLGAAEKNLLEIVRRARAKVPGLRVVIAGMEAPPNLGPAYTARFHAIFPDLARKSDAALIPFLLAGVAGDPRLNQPDHMHPTAAGHRIVAENVWKVLEPVLRRVAAGERAAAGR